MTSCIDGIDVLRVARTPKKHCHGDETSYSVFCFHRTSVSLDPGALLSGRGRRRTGARAQREPLRVTIHTWDIDSRKRDTTSCSIRKAIELLFLYSLISTFKMISAGLNTRTVINLKKRREKVVCTHFDLYCRLWSPPSSSDSIMVPLIGFVQLVIHWDSCWVTNNVGTRCAPQAAHRIQSGSPRDPHSLHTD